MDDSERAAAEVLSLRGNALLRLDDRSASWTVVSGSLGLFGVEPGPGGAGGGARRFFFSVGPGESLFGIGAPQPGAPAVVAVALEDARLVREALSEPTAPDSERTAVWRDRWRSSLTRLDPSQRAKGSLTEFHDELLEGLAWLAREEAGEEIRRFESSARLSRESAAKAVSELTSVLRPGQDGLPGGPDLFVATWAVGQASGIVFEPPPRWREGTERTDPVESIASASHVRSRLVLLHDGWWRRDCGPMLAFHGTERKPVALLPRSPGHYDVFDPASGSRRPLSAEMASSLDPRAHVFYRPLPAEASSGWQLIRFALRGRRADALTLFGAATAATLLGMFAPQATALLVDHAIPDADVPLLWQLGLGLTAAALGSAAFRFTQGLSTLRIETGADVVTQSAVWDRLLNLQMAFFRRFSSGDLLSRVTAISQIRNYLSGTTLRTLFGSVVALLNLGLLLHYSPALTLVALALALIGAMITIGSGLLLVRCQRRVLDLQGRFFGLLVQLIHGVAKLRVAAAEERAFGQWARAYAGLARLELRQQAIRDHVHVANLGLASASVIVLFAVAAGLVGQSDGGSGISTGVFLAFNMAYGTFIGAVVALSNTVTDVLAIAVLRERARPILEELPEVDLRKTDPGRLSGRIALGNIVFKYRPDGPVILDGVSLSAEAGEFVAIVGPSGSGKSTLFRVLLGFESPQSGTVQYDGQDLAGLDVQSVRRQLGVVLQEGRINAGSLFDNIACGAQFSLNDAWAAAQDTGFAEDIAAMPMGMHTMVSEGGTNLSGGQRQRLLLTRALVHKPRLLLLDEATSALDNQTQFVVCESLERLEVTRIAIAHRLSTIRRADRVYVLDAGRVVQHGTFEELAQAPGLFARLMARQLA